VIKTYKFRLYPNCLQEQKLLKTIDLCRNLYNASLEERKSYYKRYHKSRTYVDQANLLSELKEDFSEYGEIYSQILQDVLKRLDKSYSSFFRRVKSGEKPGFPRFLGKDRYNSFTYTQSGFKIVGNRLHLSKIGAIKILQHREIIGKIKTCTITKDNLNHWYVCFSTEVEKQPLQKTNKTVGIDLGVKTFISTSDGEAIASPKFLNKHLEKLAKLSRRFQKKPSNGNKHRLSRLNHKILNCRNDFLHKITTKLIKEYDVIITEDLDVKSMVSKDNHKGRAMRRHMHDVSFGKFNEMLSYKAEYADKTHIKVPPKNTSKMCYCCKNIKEDLTLSDRIYICNKCNLNIDRDYNASLNILNLGLQAIACNPRKDRNVSFDKSRSSRL